MLFNRYRDYNTYLRETFGERVQKISLDSGLGCPNRDGTISSKGCIFCDSRGSGTGAMINHGLGLEEQIAEGLSFAEKKYKAKKFIAYFQSFTNTYAPVSHLKEIYQTALNHTGMVGLSVGTRPDCVDDDVLSLLSSFKKDYLVWIEYGLQSANDVTLSKINRGHNVACFERAVLMAKAHGLNICAHVILGLPGETHDMMMDTARFIAALPIDGIKIHSLFVIRGTALSELYKNGEYACLEREAYIETLIDFLEIIPPEMIVQRLTGDPNASDLIAPQWTLEKNNNIRLIKKRLEERDTWQGKKYVKSIVAD
jgi:radical SAM protein (TIGR01212 family)